MKRLINSCNVNKLNSVVSDTVLGNVFFGKFSNSLIVDEEADKVVISCIYIRTLLYFKHYSNSNVYFYKLVAVECCEVSIDLKIQILLGRE